MKTMNEQIDDVPSRRLGYSATDRPATGGAVAMLSVTHLTLRMLPDE